MIKLVAGSHIENASQVVARLSAEDGLAPFGPLHARRLMRQLKAGPATASGIERWFRVELAPGADAEEALSRLGTLDYIEKAERIPIVRLLEEPNDPYFQESSVGTWGQAYHDMWGLRLIDVSGAWDLSTGDPDVVIAVIDSGLDFTHEDIGTNYWTNDADPVGDSNGDGYPGLAGVDDDGDGLIDEDSSGNSRYLPGGGENPEYTNDIPADDDENGYQDDWRGWDWVDPNGPDGDPTPSVAHGTHVAGTIAAAGDNGVGVVGVMWRAQVMALRTFESSTADVDDNVEAILYAVDNGASVISMSWGGVGPAPSHLVDAIAYAHSQGVVAVAAAGNATQNFARQPGLTYPAYLGHVISVAAYNELDERCDFSNFGEELDVSAPGCGTTTDDEVDAPGNNILSLKATQVGENLPKRTVGEHYLRLRGTSMACPHVAGVAGLLRSYDPSLTPEEVRWILRASADNAAGLGVSDEGGYGRINAADALVLRNTMHAQQLPELVIRGFSVRPHYVRPTDPITATMVVENIGFAPAAGIPVDLVAQEGDHYFLLDSTVIPSLGAGESVQIELSSPAPTVGEWEVSAIVDSFATVSEYSKKNNLAGRPLWSGSARIQNYAVTERRLNWGPAQPVLGDNEVIWVAGDYHATDIQLQDFGADGVPASGDDPARAEVTDDEWPYYSRDVSAGERNIVWVRTNGDTSAQSLSVYDLGPDGAYGTGDDGGEATVSEAVGSIRHPATDGATLSWEEGSTALRVYDLGADGVYGGADGGLYSIDDSTRCGSPAIDARLLAYTCWYEPASRVGVWLYDMGTDERFGDASDPGEMKLAGEEGVSYSVVDVSGTRVVWLESAQVSDKKYLDTIELYDIGPDFVYGTSDDSSATLASGTRRWFGEFVGAPSISDRRIVWTEKRRGNMEVVLYDLGADGVHGTADDAEYEITLDLYNQESAEIENDVISWETYEPESGISTRGFSQVYAATIEPTP